MTKNVHTDDNHKNDKTKMMGAELTAKIQVDSMTQIATSWNPTKERGNRYKFKENWLWVGSYCLKPLRVAVREHIPSSFRPHDGEALFKVVHGLNTACYPESLKYIFYLRPCLKFL